MEVVGMAEVVAEKMDSEEEGVKVEEVEEGVVVQMVGSECVEDCVVAVESMD